MIIFCNDIYSILVFDVLTESVISIEKSFQIGPLYIACECEWVQVRQNFAQSICLVQERSLLKLKVIGSDLDVVPNYVFFLIE